MADQPGMGMKILAIAGGVALLIVAWRFPVPLFVVKPTTLLSMVAVLLGIMVGWKQAAIITCLYVLALVLGLPQAVWGGHASGEPFLDVPTNGLNLGLIAAALVAGKLTPKGPHTAWSKLAIVIFVAHLAYLAVGIAWMTRFAPLAAAAPAILKSQIIPVLVKSALGFGIVAGSTRFFKR